MARLDLNGVIGGDPEAMAIELNVMSWVGTHWKGYNLNYWSHFLF